MKTKKKLLIWGSVVNFIVAAFSLYCVIAITNNINGVQDYVIAIIKQSFQEDMVEGFLNLLNTYYIVDVICNLGFGIIYLVYANYSLEKFNRSKRSLLVLTVISVLFGLNLITLILVLFALFGESRRDVKAEEVINNAQVPDDSDKFYVLAEQITILKTKLQNNEITEEQINDYAKQNGKPTLPTNPPKKPKR